MRLLLLPWKCVDISVCINGTHIYTDEAYFMFHPSMPLALNHALKPQAVPYLDLSTAGEPILQGQSKCSGPELPVV